MKTSKSDFLKVAYISKAHGIKGELFLRPLHPQASWPRILKNIYIGDSLSVFSVKQYKQVQGGWIFALRSVKNRERAEKLKSKAVFLPKKNFTAKKGELIYLAELIGFRVETPKKLSLGIVQSFKSNASQDFLLIKKKTEVSEILIPFVESYILKIDFDAKKLIMNLPKDFLKTFSHIKKKPK